MIAKFQVLKINILQTGKSCDHENEKKIEMDLGEWSTRFRYEHKEKLMCIQDLARIQIWLDVLFTSKKVKEMNLGGEIGTTSTRSLNPRLRILTFGFLALRWEGEETVTLRTRQCQL